PDHDWNKTLPAVQGTTQTWISELARQADSRSSFNELLDTPLDFSNFIMNQLRVDILTPELLVGPTFDLMKGRFYGFAVNQESALDVYSKRKIIAVTDLKIVEWHNYKHLDWILVRRDDDKIYKFKEGNFKRLRLQDIEDMLLLLVQGKLSNLTVEELFAFNVSLRMFTRSIVIQRRVEDLQLRVESYQKRLNLTKLDTYRFDLKRREAYTAYSNTRGFIYQNKDKKNKLMRIDELDKFSDGTLNDVRNALDDPWNGLLEDDCMRETSGCYKGPYDSSYAAPIFTEIQEPLNYDKHALWGVSHWGRKRQQLYRFAVNRESALDVYSKRRIIPITDLKIVEWHNYKHLDWISLSNLTVEECFAFNVSLRMFTRSIVIQRRVKDLQLGVESYQKRLNLTKPDTYRSDLKRREAYTAYSNPRGFIYQNRDKKYSDETLNDVRNALDDRLKGIKMQYLPQAFWGKDDKDRAAAMIQSIDKMLKTRRIMRSLKRFVGGLLYERDFRMLQRTI
nr:hypothetical protein [Tanacetum cinerariifolium]